MEVLRAGFVERRRHRVAAPPVHPLQAGADDIPFHRVDRPRLDSPHHRGQALAQDRQGVVVEQLSAEPFMTVNQEPAEVRDGRPSGADDLVVNADQHRRIPDRRQFPGGVPQRSILPPVDVVGEVVPHQPQQRPNPLASLADVVDGFVEVCIRTEHKGVDGRLEPAVGHAPNCLADLFPG
jgi:hypothetical protein